MSGFNRKVRRAKTFAQGNVLTGFKGGKRLAAMLPRIGNESYATHARRYVRISHQVAALRKAGVVIGDDVPVDLTGLATE